MGAVRSTKLVTISIPDVCAIEALLLRCTKASSNFGGKLIGVHTFVKKFCTRLSSHAG